MFAIIAIRNDLQCDVLTTGAYPRPAEFSELGFLESRYDEYIAGLPTPAKPVRLMIKGEFRGAEHVTHIINAAFEVGMANGVRVTWFWYA